MPYLHSSKKLIGNVLSAFLDILYPPLCIHCHEHLNPNSTIFCPGCAALLDLINPIERCPFCFSGEYCPEKKICEECRPVLQVINGMASSFDYMGPPATLIKAFKYSNQPYLAKGAAAFIAAQFFQLNWPKPDFIVPVPIAFTHWLDRGYNQSELLAETLSEILQVPVKKALKRRSGDYSQAGLSRQQRMRLEGKTFVLKEQQFLQDKCILLVDDVMTTGSTLKKCAEALREDYPEKIYGITLCRAIN